ncbi:hypothetical protein TWF694_007120 [Orbilia ellipsospora]|uniref:Ubiquitin carboxyl-terminal hydrolase n=1 Tax=Orbilia ellipsospora TaxID=2528407 RepID=A0AAV9XNN9_9PEZI
MNNQPYSQIPPQGPYIPPQMMGPPPPPPLHHHHHHHHHHHQAQHQHPQTTYQPHPQHANPYSQHQHTPNHVSQTSDFRPPHFHHPNRPLIVSTPTSYIPQYPPPMMPHPMANSFYRPPQMHPGVPPYYPSQEIIPPPPDIPSPASLPQEAIISNPASSPSRSVDAIEETNEPRYETPITSSSSPPQSPMIPSVLPLTASASFKPLKLPWYSSPGEPFPQRKVRNPKKQTLEMQISSQQQIQGFSGSNSRHIPNSFGSSDPKSSDDALQTKAPLNEEFTPNEAEEHDPKNTSLLSNNQPTPESPIKTSRPAALTAIPIIPFIPAIHKPRKNAEISTTSITELPSTDSKLEAVNNEESGADGTIAVADFSLVSNHNPPKSWADLVRSKTSKDSNSPSKSVSIAPNGLSSAALNNTGEMQTRTLSEVLQTFTMSSPRGSHLNSLVPLIEPRGLINTGNMCFMNSILQALLYCGNFFSFLDLISRNVAHNFKSETPLIDAMIMFMREFQQINSSSNSTDKLVMDTKLAGDPFVPEYVYEAVRGLKRFSSMRRGHQQDAEEFLNFFLDVLHEECVAAMKLGPIIKSGGGIESHRSDDDDDDSGWLEVGHKQRAAITRNVGHISGKSPVTKIFGGQMRNELRVSGQRSSVMREPYQSLQLDIQGSNVSSIVDAIRQISVPEQLQGGDFKSARGASASATKQTYIENLPPVLILHLKRFQYNNTGGTQKIWKSISYPLELEIPDEVLSPARRSAPQKARYKLSGVVYHHGKSATNGHYTVDVKRQDGWLRIDDTSVKRISGNHVTVDDFFHSREYTRKLGSEDSGWKEVSFATKVSGKAPTTNTNSNKEDKVAYLLFYELQ